MYTHQTPEFYSADRQRPLRREDTLTKQQIEHMTVRFDRIEQALALLVQQRTIKEWYSTAEVAKLLGKAEFTVRESCRLGRVHAKKKVCGRGATGEWIIAHKELTRVGNEGLLP